MDLNVISKIDEKTLSQSARMIISQIELYQREQIKSKLLKDLNNGNKDQLNGTVYVEEHEQEKLFRENVLFEELNDELKDKNKLLKEVLQNEKQRNIQE